MELYLHPPYFYGVMFNQAQGQVYILRRTLITVLSIWVWYFRIRSAWCFEFTGKEY